MTPHHLHCILFSRRDTLDPAHTSGLGCICRHGDHGVWILSSCPRRRDKGKQLPLLIWTSAFQIYVRHLSAKWSWELPNLCFICLHPLRKSLWRQFSHLVLMFSFSRLIHKIIGSIRKKQRPKKGEAGTKIFFTTRYRKVEKKYNKLPSTHYSEETALTFNEYQYKSLYKMFPEHHFHITQQASKINAIFLKDKINICMQNTDTQDGVKKIVQRYITGRTRIYHILFIYFLQFSFCFSTTPFPLPSLFLFFIIYLFLAMLGVFCGSQAFSSWWVGAILHFSAWISHCGWLLLLLAQALDVWVSVVAALRLSSWGAGA